MTCSQACATWPNSGPCLFCAWFCGNDTGHVAVILDYNLKLGMLIHHCLELVFVWRSCFGFVCLVFRDRVSLCSPGCPGTHSVDQAGLELRNPPASAPQVLGLRRAPPQPGKHTVFKC